MVILLQRLGMCIALATVLSCIGAADAMAAPPAGWTVVDLGTLGGGSSHVSAVNSAGEVVGDSDTADGFTHAFSWTAPNTLHDLGTLPGGSYSTAVAVNASGQIAGYADTSSGSMHAVRWSAAGIAQDLGDLGGGDSTAIAINASGTVVGTSTTATGEQHAFSFTGNGPMVDLGTLGGTFSTADGVNASGQVTGSSTILGDTEEHAFLWTKGTRTDLGTATYTSRPTAINDAGQVVGFRQPTDNAALQMGFLRAGGITVIGSGSAFTSANAINASGQIAGVDRAAAGVTIEHAFSRTPAGVMTDIGTLGGTYGAAYAVNASGAVVGSSTIANDAETHAFLWTAAGGLLDLSTLGGTDSFGVGLNDNGLVIGQSSTASGDTHAAAWQRTAVVDSTPPVISSNVTGPLGADGWYTGDVTVTWTALDAESAISTPACATSTVTADTAGTTFTCSAASAGGIATQSVTIRRATPLAATPTPLPTPAATVTPVVPVTPAVTPVVAVPVVTKTRSIRVSTSLSPKLEDGHQRVLVTLTAPAGATASGSIRLKATLGSGKGAKLRNVGSASFRLGSGQKKTFTVVLATGGKAVLVRIGHLRVSVIIAAKDAAGKTHPATRSIKLAAKATAKK